MTQTQSSLLTLVIAASAVALLFAVFLARWVLSRAARHAGDAEDLQRDPAGRGGIPRAPVQDDRAPVRRRRGAARRGLRLLPPHDGARPGAESEDLRAVRHGVVPARRAELGRRRLRRHVGVDPLEHPRRRGGDDVAQRRAPDGAAGRCGVGTVHRRDEPPRRRRAVRRAVRLRAGRHDRPTSGRSTSPSSSSATDSARPSSRCSRSWAAASTRRRRTSAPTSSARSKREFPKTIRAIRPSSRISSATTSVTAPVAAPTCSSPPPPRTSAR